ncbi:hypothetical protein COCNU_15G002150 [Cocos nucifera]|uniref:Uncharacterized protein n=1 Tax=Cocos nucifera TaxID=13894 RepID=A0A8K0NCP6_COCNU|nr:hypothetical protein COCNU_15G002150 [Cocos nucifera]
MSIRFDDDDDQHGPEDHEISSMKASSKLFDSTPTHQAMPRQHKEGGNVVESAKQPGMPRWRKRIGRLFKLARWKMATG